MMKLNIADLKALSAVSPSALTEYLRSRGWEAMRVEHDLGWFHKVIDGDDVEFDVPLRHSARDYPRRVRDVLENLRIIENRSQYDIYQDLIRPNQAVTEAGAEPLADAASVLGRLVESLVISYELDQARETFTLVADYPDRARGAQRSFIALRFSGVRGYRRAPGNLADLQTFTTTYSVAASPRPIVIQHLGGAGNGGDRRLDLSFGPNFGELSFSYDVVTGFVRHTRVEERDGDWIYLDAQSGEQLDFAQPFAGALDPS